MKRWFLKYSRIVVLLALVEGVVLYRSDTTLLLYYLLISPAEVFQQNYPRYWWLVYAAVKGHLPVLTAWSIYYFYFYTTLVMQAYQQNRASGTSLAVVLEERGFGFVYTWIKAAQRIICFLKQLPRDRNIDLWKQLGITVGVTIFFCLAYYILAYLITKPEDFFEAQLQLSHCLLMVLLLQGAVALWFSRNRLKQYALALLSTQGSAVTLAVVRMFAGYQLYNQSLLNLKENVHWSTLPDSMRVGLPFMDWFVLHVPITPNLYQGACYGLLVCSVLIMAGLFTRTALVLGVLLGIYVIGVPMFYGKLFHRHLAVWIPVILAFSPCADAWSVDRFIKKMRGHLPVVTPHPKYHLPVLLILLQVGLIYFFAGVIKLKDCGLAWALGDNMINQIYVEWAQAYDKVPAIRIDHYPALLHVGGMAVILFEIYFPFLVLHRWGRWLAFAGGLAMHNIIGYFMYISFAELQKVYVVFIDWGRVLAPGSWLTKNGSSPGSYTWRQLWLLTPYKWTLCAGCLLLLLNFSCGMFHIHSWPFSSYPTYSTMVPAERYWVLFDVHLPNGDSIAVYQEGEQAEFRMESYTLMEQDIAANYSERDTVLLKRNVQKLWQVWVANVPVLKQAATVQAWLCLSPIYPGKTQVVLSKQYLTSVNISR